MQTQTLSNSETPWSTHDEKHVEQWGSIHKSINKTEVPTHQQFIAGHANTVTLEVELLRYDTSA